VLYIKEIFENWIQIVNKNQNTKLSRTNGETAGDSPKMTEDAQLEYGFG
jgi:hypothetical protein